MRSLRRETHALLGVHRHDRDAEIRRRIQVRPQQGRGHGVERDRVAGRGEGAGGPERLGEGEQFGEPLHVRRVEPPRRSSYGLPRGIRPDPGVARPANERTGSELQVVLPLREQTRRHGNDRAGFPPRGVVRLALAQLDAQRERRVRLGAARGDQLTPRRHAAILPRTSDIAARPRGARPATRRCDARGDPRHYADSSARRDEPARSARAHGIRPARETTRRDRRPGVGAASGHVDSGQDERAIRASTPCTNEPESSVENSFASSTASSIATAVGTSSL